MEAVAGAAVVELEATVEKEALEVLHRLLLDSQAEAGLVAVVMAMPIWVVAWFCLGKVLAVSPAATLSGVRVAYFSGRPRLLVAGQRTIRITTARGTLVCLVHAVLCGAQAAPIQMQLDLTATRVRLDCSK